MGRGCSQDPRQLCAQAENGQAGRGSYLEAAVGETVSPVVEAECGDAGSAAVVTPPGQAGRDPNEGEEQLATPGDESGDAEEESAGRARGWSSSNSWRCRAGRGGGGKICSSCSRS